MVENTEEDEPRSLEEIQYSSQEVRVEMDGDLYAYRDGKHHVIVADTNQNKHQWFERVPAVRTHVIRGEYLWTIPSNWSHIVSNGHSHYFSIEDSDVDVKVRNKDKYGVNNQRYEVRLVGEFNARWDKTWKSYAAKKASEQAESDASKDVADALLRIRREREDYQQWFAQYVADEGTDRLEKMGGTEEQLPSGKFNDWYEPFDLSEFLTEYTHVDEDLISEVLDYIQEFDIFPEYPSVRARIDDNGTLPDDYQTRALIQSGCSADEGVDYLMTEVHNVEVDKWADERQLGKKTVQNNVDHAERILEKRSGSDAVHRYME